MKIKTFANFANFGLFRESLSRESFPNGISRKFIQWNFDLGIISSHTRFFIRNQPIFTLKNFETKNRDSRKFISQNLFNFSIRESLSREISSICQIAKVYPKKFASFWVRESFSRESFSD